MNTPPTLNIKTPLRIQLRNEMLMNRNEVLTLWTRLWRALCLYSFRHWRTSYRGRPVGIPGERDPLFPCSAYTPRAAFAGEHPLCVYPDNHYLCDHCCENATRKTPPSKDQHLHPTPAAQALSTTLQP